MKDKIIISFIFLGIALTLYLGFSGLEKSIISSEVYETEGTILGYNKRNRKEYTQYPLIQYSYSDGNSYKVLAGNTYKDQTDKASKGSKVDIEVRTVNLFGRERQVISVKDDRFKYADISIGYRQSKYLSLGILIPAIIIILKPSSKRRV